MFLIQHDSWLTEWPLMYQYVSHVQVVAASTIFLWPLVDPNQVFGGLSVGFCLTH